MLGLIMIVVGSLLVLDNICDFFIRNLTCKICSYLSCYIRCIFAQGGRRLGGELRLSLIAELVVCIQDTDHSIDLFLCSFLVFMNKIWNKVARKIQACIIHTVHYKI